MSIPDFTPATQTNRLVLPSTGSALEVTEENLPYGLYLGSEVDQTEKNSFISGAVSQVAYTYKMLGGDNLDIELTTCTVYAAYEAAVMKYSYLINLHQAKNSLADYLGQPTGSFNHKGQYESGSYISSSLNGGNVASKYPKMNFGYARRYSDGVGAAIGIGGYQTVYSASVNTTGSVQDYDLQQIIHSQSLATDQLYSGKINNKNIRVRKVYYLSPRAVWRFYGYYGGLAAVGNLSTYGQFADDHTFQLVPVWQNKAQAAAYEDAINTRISHYSYQLRNNKLRIFPPPDTTFNKIWIEFTVDEEPWENSDGIDQGVDGVNNVNSLPFANIQYNKINSIGKHWIREYALALAKEILAYNRGKFTTLPIPGESVTLNHSELLSQAKQEQKDLIDQLKQDLEDMTYSRLAEQRASQSDSVNRVLEKMPTVIYIG